MINKPCRPLFENRRRCNRNACPTCAQRRFGQYSNVMYTLGGTVGVNYWWINSERVRRPELDDRFEHWIGIPHHAYDVLLFGVEDTPRERSDEVIEALANAWRREDISRRVMFSKSTRCWHDYDPFWREKSGWESDRLHRSAVIEHEQQAGRLTAVEALEPPEQFRSA